LQNARNLAGEKIIIEQDYSAEVRIARKKCIPYLLDEKRMSTGLYLRNDQLIVDLCACNLIFKRIFVLNKKGCRWTTLE
jgi:hypothetical protein